MARLFCQIVVMGLRPLGDSAWLFEAGGKTPEGNLELILRLRRLLKLNPIPEIVDIVSSFDTIAVHFNPLDGEAVFNHLTDLHLDQVADDQPVDGYTITVPVVYGDEYGPDLQSLADAKRITAREVADIHRGAEYTVAAIGFSPGFPYLLGLPEQLHRPRHATPRKVPAGAVAVAGHQAGIYPFASQAGWHVIGRTDLTLFDPDREDPALLQPGDKVRFVEMEKLNFEQPAAHHIDPVTTGIHVIEAGAFSSIQDHGRWGKQHLGVSPGGAADPVLATIANRLVGNDDDAAVIECTMTGPVLQFDIDARIAWVGWADETSGRPHDLKAGARVDFSGRMSHLRGYIAVAGGIDVPVVLGSRSTDIRAKMGGHQGRILKNGDILAIGEAEAGPVSDKWHVAWPQPSGYMIEVRYVRGIQADWFTNEANELLHKSFYEISPASDRMGCRLKGEKLKLHQPREMVSQPVVPGSIQVPPDGHPIVLMSERQTIGGYPQIGHVISADIPKLARSWPGTRVHFQEVSVEDARYAWNELQRDLGILSAGLMTLT